LLEAKLTTGSSEIMIATRGGKCIRFPEEKVRSVGRTSIGVRGIDLSEGDEVIGMIVVNDLEKDSVLVVSERGYGKRTAVEDYRITNRGGKGVITLNITDKTGDLIAIQSVTDEDGLMIINKSGVAIRMGLDELRIMGRNTQGVRLINLKNTDEIAAVAKVTMDKEVVEESEEISETEGVESESQATPSVNPEETDSKENSLENDKEE
jgi:DNA gyrase subunit A